MRCVVVGNVVQSRPQGGGRRRGVSTAAHRTRAGPRVRGGTQESERNVDAIDFYIVRQASLHIYNIFLMLCTAEKF